MLDPEVPEVPERPVCRRFSAQYKLDIDPAVASMYIGAAAIVVGLTATRVTTAVAFGKGR